MAVMKNATVLTFGTRLYDYSFDHLAPIIAGLYDVRSAVQRMTFVSVCIVSWGILAICSAATGQRGLGHGNTLTW